MQRPSDELSFPTLLANARLQVEKGNYDAADQALTQALSYWQDLIASGTSRAPLDGEEQRLRQSYLDALIEAVRTLEARRDYGRALTCARALLRYDPSYGPMVQHLIHLYVLSHSRPGALATLERRLALAKAGHGGLLFFSGVPGIGKTSLALVAEAWSQANGAGFARAHAYERGMPPFQLWQDVLAGLETLANLDLVSLPEPFGRAAPAQSTHHLARALSLRLQTAAATSPLVLLFDDLHWADQDSLNLLEMVSRNLKQAGLLITVTYRGDVLQRDHPLYQLLPTLQRNRPAETIELAPLDLEGTRLLAEAYHGPCSLALARYLHERAEGHPLFLVELLADLTGRNLLGQDEAGEWLPPARDVPVPVMLQQLIGQRVTQLGPQAETFLMAAAVVGESWRLPIVEGLLDWPESTLLDVLESVLAARIVAVEDQRGERYRFAHGLIREVLYEQQLARRRKRLHRQIAVLLEQPSPTDPAALAYHFYEAEQWDKAYRYSLEAGQTARQRIASHSALQFYQQALDCLRMLSGSTPHQFVSLHEQLGETYALLNQRVRATETFKQMVEAARAAEDKLAEGRALLLLASNQERAYLREEAAASREAAMQLAQEIEDPYLLALNSYNFGFRYGLGGQLEQARRYLDQAEGYARSLAEPDLLANILRAQGLHEVWEGHYATAEDVLSEAQEWAWHGQNAYGQISLYAWRGLAEIEQGHYMRARATLDKGLTRVVELDEDHLLQIRLLNISAYLFSELGDQEQARQHSQRALEAGRRRTEDDNFEPTCYALLELATEQLRAGQEAAAVRYIQEFESICDRATDYARFRYMNRYQLLQAELALAQDQFEEALAHSAAASQEARARGLRKNVAKSRLFEGQALMGLGQPGQAIEPLQQAVALADEIGHGSLRWQTRLRLAQARSALAEPSAAKTYQEALSLVKAIADQLTEKRLRHTFLNSPMVVELHAVTHSTTASPQPPSPEPPSAQSTPAGLTPREVEVLRLVAQGMTNRQIGEALHISVRTVNTHVTNILNKTACDNRTAAAAFALQHGLV